MVYFVTHLHALAPLVDLDMPRYLICSVWSDGNNKYLPASGFDFNLCITVAL